MHPSHDLDIYPVRLHLITTKRQWREHHETLPMSTPEAPCSGAFTETTLDTHSGVLHVTVWVDVKRHRKYDIDLWPTAVHEAVHAGAAILDHFGQRYDGESEALAYLVDWLASWLTCHIPRERE